MSLVARRSAARRSTAATDCHPGRYSARSASNRFIEAARRDGRQLATRAVVPSTMPSAMMTEASVNRPRPERRRASCASAAIGE
jgi:hypothetical protein